MAFYNAAVNTNPNLNIRVHPLILSLTETINASETNPDIKTISENDERALRSNFYTPHNAFPPLEIHFSGQNGRSLSNQNSYYLTCISAAGCQECISSALQNSSGGNGNPTEGTEAEGDIALVENLKNEIDALKSRCNKLEKTVKDMEYNYNTHERYLETFRKEIITLHSDRGTLDLSYPGGEFELMESKVTSDTLE
jgi:hypothetical protein